MIKGRSIQDFKQIYSNRPDPNQTQSASHLLSFIMSSDLFWTFVMSSLTFASKFECLACSLSFTADVVTLAPVVDVLTGEKISHSCLRL